MEAKNTLPKSKTLLISNFANTDYKIEIPRYQRPFSWTKTEAKQLIDDLLKSVLDNYYIGTIYFHKDGKVIKLIDGQQRSMTLFMLCSILDIEEITHIKKKFRLNIKADDYINGLIASNQDPDGFVEKNLSDVYNFMKTYVHEVEGRDEVLVNKIKNIALTYVDLSDITMNPHIIFNSLNNRGMSLSTLDKVKNLLLAAGDDKDPDKILNKWNSLMKKISKIGEKSLFRNFMKEYYTLTTANHTDGKLLSHLEDEFNMWKKKTKASEKKAAKQVDKYIGVADKYTDLYNAKTDWKKITKYDSITASSKSLQKQLVEFLMNSSFKQGTPVLIKALTLSKIAKKKSAANKATFKNILMLTSMSAIDVILGGTRGNIFANNVKESLFEVKTLKQLEKKLFDYHDHNQTHRKLINVFLKYSYEENNKSKGKVFKMFSYIVYNHTKSTPLIPSTLFNFEHPWKRSINDSGFILEEKLNSDIGGRKEEDYILSRYQESSIQMIKKAKNAKDIKSFYEQYKIDFIKELLKVFDKFDESKKSLKEIKENSQLIIIEKAQKKKK